MADSVFRFNLAFRCSKASALTHQRRSGGKALPEFPSPLGLGQFRLSLPSLSGEVPQRLSPVALKAKLNLLEYCLC